MRKLTNEQIIFYLNRKKCATHLFDGIDAGISAGGTSMYLQQCCCHEFSDYLGKLFLAIKNDNITEDDLRRSSMRNTLIPDNLP